MISDTAAANNVNQLSNAETYNVVPEILHRFIVAMAHGQPWKTRNSTCIMQSNFICELERRGQRWLLWELGDRLPLCAKIVPKPTALLR